MGEKRQNKEVAYDCFSLIALDSVIRRNDKYYPQTLLEKCKYRIKKSKKKNWINNNFASDLSDNKSNIGIDSEPDSDADDNESEKSSKKSD